MTKTVQELRLQRLENLKKLLANELASDKPALRYIEDLSDSIAYLMASHIS